MRLEVWDICWGDACEGAQGRPWGRLEEPLDHDTDPTSVEKKQKMKKKIEASDHFIVLGVSQQVARNLTSKVSH